MFAYKAKTVWSIHRRRMLWYLALSLLVTVDPQALVRSLRWYLCLSAGADCALLAHESNGRFQLERHRATQP